MNQELHIIAKLEYGKLIAKLSEDRVDKIQTANRIPPGGQQKLAVLEVYLGQAEQICRGYAKIWQDLLETSNGGYLLRSDVDFINGEIATMTNTQASNLLKNPQVPHLASFTGRIQRDLHGLRHSIKNDLEIRFRKQQAFPPKKEPEPMAKPKEPPAQPPTLSAEKAIPIIEGLIVQADTLNQEERTQWVNNGKGAIIAALGSTHSNVNAFCLARDGGFFYIGMSEPERLAQHNEQLAKMVAVLKSTVDQLRWQLPDSKQVFLPAGTQHSAYQEIRKVVELSTKEIQIVDGYVDGALWMLLTNLPVAAKIRVMTMQMKGDFILEAKKFAAQHGSTVEIREMQSYHDRFIVVDGNRCWHLGASIKDAGNKACLISEIEGGSLCAAVRADVDATWNSARVIL
jgi:hypothetical protein